MGAKAIILLVEEQPTEGESLETLLRAENYEPHVIRDAQEALTFVEADIDLVVCHLSLEGASGIDLMRAWKRLRPGTPFILVSSVAEAPWAAEAFQEGAAACIAKPFHPSQLLAHISDCLERANIPSGKVSRLDAPHRATQEDALELALPADASLDEIERAAIEKALEKHRGNRTRAAHALGISVRTLQRKLKAWGAVELNGTSAP